MMAENTPEPALELAPVGFGDNHGLSRIGWEHDPKPATIVAPTTPPSTVVNPTSTTVPPVSGTVIAPATSEIK